ncbi:MAG: hypothetical protein ACLGHG_01215 [Gammaproteobacteria bacterium]
MRIAGLLLGVLLSLSLPVLAQEAAAQKGVVGNDSFAGPMALDQPIEIGIDVKGVKMQSVYFSGTEAMVIMWNRRPQSAKVTVDVALYDGAGKMLAVGQKKFSLSAGTIRAGKQSNYKFDFGSYLQDMGAVAAFSAVFSVAEQSSNTSRTE